MKKNEEYSGGSLRKRQKAETYSIIFKVAVDMFESVGYEKTTMRKIAAKAGISPGAIFKHFENKSAILATKLFDDIEIVQEKAIDTIPEKVTIDKQFLHIAESFFKYYDLTPVLSKILVKHSVFIEGIWSEKLQNQMRHLGDVFEELIQEGKERNEIKNDVDNKALVMAFLSSYMWALLLFVNDSELTVEAALEMLETIVNQTMSGARFS